MPYSQAKKSRYHRLTLLVILREPRFESFFFSFFNSSSRQHLLSMSLPTIFTLKDHYTQTRKMFRNNSFTALLANILGRAVECQFRQEITLSPKYPNASTTLSHEKQSFAEAFQRIPSPRRFIFTQIFFLGREYFRLEYARVRILRVRNEASDLTRFSRILSYNSTYWLVLSRVLIFPFPRRGISQYASRFHFFAVPESFKIS